MRKLAVSSNISFWTSVTQMTEQFCQWMMTAGERRWVRLKAGSSQDGKHDVNASGWKSKYFFYMIFFRPPCLPMPPPTPLDTI